MSYYCPNHPFVVWAACFLWLTSMFAIVWSLILFFCVGDMLVITGTDLVNSVVLLSGVIMLPTNLYILFAIANGKKIDRSSKVTCCPLWLCILWIIGINTVGAILCMYKIAICKNLTEDQIKHTMLYYRTMPNYKRFVDDMQWSLKCCGLVSYRDWFNNNWFDNIRDYEWDPRPKRRRLDQGTMRPKTVSDSVPFSCCKSGSCISNYLLELGTNFINTRGCGNLMYHIVLSSMIMHLIMFVAVIVVEIIVLSYILPKKELTKVHSTRQFTGYSNCSRSVLPNIRHIMAVKENFSASSASLQINPNDSDEFERIQTLRATTPRYMRQPSHMDITNFQNLNEEFSN